MLSVDWELMLHHSFEIVLNGLIFDHLHLKSNMGCSIHKKWRPCGPILQHNVLCMIFKIECIVSQAMQEILYVCACVCVCVFCCMWHHDSCYLMSKMRWLWSQLMWMFPPHLMWHRCGHLGPWFCWQGTIIHVELYFWSISNLMPLTLYIIVTIKKCTPSKINDVLFSWLSTQQLMYVGVIWFLFQVLQLLQNRITQQNLGCVYDETSTKIGLKMTPRLI